MTDEEQMVMQCYETTYAETPLYEQALTRYDERRAKDACQAATSTFAHN